jgi:hypothetical protein
MLLNTAFWRALDHRIAYRDAMPTLTVTHEAPLELIRQHPSLALELVRATLNVPLPESLEARLGPTDLNYVVPAQFTADSVITLHDPATGEPALAVIVEPQGRDTPISSTPGRPTSPTSAARLSAPELSSSSSVRTPWRARNAVRASPPVTPASTCWGTEPGARRVLNAVHDSATSAADRERLITLILKAAPAAARQILEDLMATTEWKSDFVESFVNVGLEKGLEQGREQGIVEGAIRAKAEAILKVLDARLLKPTKDQRGQVNAATDIVQLDRWFDRALNAATTAEVFAD